MIEHLPEAGEMSELVDKINEIIDNVNELQEKYDKHVHYARELQFSTDVPDNPHVYSRDR